MARDVRRAAASPLFVAERAALRGERAVALDAIRRVHQRRLSSPRRDALGSPDAVLAEARVLVAAGDSAGAAVWLDSALAHVRDYPLAAFQKSGAAVGSILLAAALRADLAAARHDVATTRRWRRRFKSFGRVFTRTEAVFDRMKALVRE